MFREFKYITSEHQVRYFTYNTYHMENTRDYSARSGPNLYILQVYRSEGYVSVPLDPGLYDKISCELKFWNSIGHRWKFAR